ncbi:DUF7144 family membrane protein [Amycolatopsis magusensis]|uniref:DUF7144 family membrane protein n=1 Tax=Amycolatopsis magusensis TaxID=882444 RepID=UPI0037B47503
MYALDLTGWGWGHLVLGALVVLAGAGVLMGTTRGRILGIAVVVLSLVANFLFLPRYPMWSLALIAVDLAVPWALAARLVSTTSRRNPPPLRGPERGGGADPPR